MNAAYCPWVAYAIYVLRASHFYRLADVQCIQPKLLLVVVPTFLYIISFSAHTILHALLKRELVDAAKDGQIVLQDIITKMHSRAVELIEGFEREPTEQVEISGAKLTVECCEFATRPTEDHARNKSSPRSARTCLVYLTHHCTV